MEVVQHRWDTDEAPLAIGRGALNDRERRIVSMLGNSEAITTFDVSQLLGLGMDRSKEIVRDLVRRGILVKHGNGRYTRYLLAESE